MGTVLLPTLHRHGMQGLGAEGERMKFRLVGIEGRLAEGGGF